MYLNKLNKININNYTTSFKGNGVEKLYVENPQETILPEKSPSNPSYWQNTIGLKKSFVPRIMDTTRPPFAYMKSEDLKKAEILLNIPERGDNVFDIYEIPKFLKSEAGQKHFERVKKFLYVPERSENQFSLEDIAHLSYIEPEKYEKVKSLLNIPERGQDSQFDGKEIYFLSELEPEYWENAKALFYIPERKHQFTGKGIADLARLTPEQMQVAKTLYNIPERDEHSQLNASEIACLAKLEPEELNQAKTLFDFSPIISGKDIAGIAKLSPENFKKTKEILNSRLTQMTSSNFALIMRYTPNLADRMIELSSIPERKQYQFKSADIEMLAQLDPTKVNEFLYIPKRKDDQLPANSISTIVRMKPEQYARIDELLYVSSREKTQFSGWEITGLARLGEEQYARAKEIFDVSSSGRKEQFSGKDICRLALLEPEQFEQAKTLFYIPELDSEQLTSEKIAELAKLKPETLTQAKTLLGKSGTNGKPLETTEIVKLSQLEPTHFSHASYLLNPDEASFKVDDIIKLSMTSPKAFKKIKAILKVAREDNRDIGAEQVLAFRKLNSERLQQAISLFPLRLGEKKKRLTSYEILDFAKLKSTQFKQAQELFNLIKNGDMRFIAISKLEDLADVTPEEFKKIKELLYVEGRRELQLSSEEILKLIRLEPKQYDKALELVYLPQLGNYQLDGKAIETLSFLGNIDEAIEKLNSQRNKVASNVDLYINDDEEDDDDNFDDDDDDDYYFIDGDYYDFLMNNAEDDDDDDIDEEDLIEESLNFFDGNTSELIQLSAILDKESLDVLFRKRLDSVGEYCDSITALDVEDIKLAKSLINSHDIYGKPFSPTQKIEFIDLLYAYKNCGIDTSKIKQMVSSNCVDIEELNFDLFQTVMKRTYLKGSEIQAITQDKISKWNMKYMHFLSSEIVKNSENMEIYSDFLRAANLFDFNSFIHDTSNIYGKSNARTKAGFEYRGMDYEKWLNPSQENEVQFLSKDNNMQQIAQIISQVEEDMSALMKTQAKGLIKKQFPKFIKGENFVVPQEHSNKIKLNELLNQLVDTSEHGQLTNIWARAEKNKNNPDNANTANTTLTVLSHLKQRIEDISTIKEGKSEKTLDLTIKMWDRNPQKDIFQGNYSTCCIGMDKGNGNAMFHYLMDTAFNMIEIVDNKTGQTIGNALCYFVTDKEGTPIFIIDNIEINNSSKPSDKVGLRLRDSIVEYAQNVTKEVTGRDDISICMSNNYNDLPSDNTQEEQKEISFLGEIDGESIYLDLYEGWTYKKNLEDTCTLLRLK